jgi:ABC-type uncharacterized transport system permease subunit
MYLPLLVSALAGVIIGTAASAVAHMVTVRSRTANLLMGLLLRFLAISQSSNLLWLKMSVS